MKNKTKEIYYKNNNLIRILLDRSSFQSLSVSEIKAVDQKYSVVCPWIFLAECLNPKKSDRFKLRQKIEQLEYVMTPGKLSHFKQQITPLSFLEIVKNSLMEKELPFSFIEVKTQKLINYYNFTGIRDLLDRYGKSFENLGLSDMLHDFGILTENSSLNTLTSVFNRLFSNQSAIAVTDPLYDLFNVDPNCYLLEEKSPANLTLIFYCSYLLFILHIGYSCKCEGFDQSIPNDFYYLFFAPFCDIFLSNDKNLLKIIDYFQYIEGLDALYFRDIKPKIRDFQTFRKYLRHKIIIA